MVKESILTTSKFNSSVGSEKKHERGPFDRRRTQIEVMKARMENMEHRIGSLEREVREIQIRLEKAIGPSSPDGSLLRSSPDGRRR